MSGKFIHLRKDAMYIGSCIKISIFYLFNHLLSTENLNTLLNRLELLFVCRRLDRSKDELGLEVPLAGNVEGLCQAGVDQRVVVLKVGAKAEGLETSPDYEMC